ncbi:CrcB family protein [Nocardioides houyundeii]|uniref:CrcB family protein n=1 Tax=Nocardioides houyundeii TaxID=2045452 RepID=UPI000C77E584|nr:CrcB family protein [Nocardioides houyundeii]
MTALLVALGAGLGASVRYSVARRLDRGWPLGTLLVNVAGSTLVGLFAGLAVGDRPWALLGVGVCGGLTTYSGFAVLAHNLGWRRGTAYAAATVALALAGCALGYAVAT